MEEAEAAAETTKAQGTSTTHTSMPTTTTTTFKMAATEAQWMATTGALDGRTEQMQATAR